MPELIVLVFLGFQAFFSFLSPAFRGPKIDDGKLARMPALTIATRLLWSRG